MMPKINEFPLHILLELSDEDSKRIWQYALDKTKLKVDYSQTVDKRENVLQNTYRSKRGERIYGRATGQKTNVKPKRGGDNGNDFRDGVDVKTVSHSEPELKVLVNCRHWPRWGYFLVQYLPNSDSFIMLGWATIDMIKNTNEQKSYGSGYPLNYWLAANQLLNLEEAIDLGLDTRTWGIKYQ